MQTKAPNGLVAMLVAITVIFSSSGLAYLSLAGTNLISNQFNETSVFYGKNVFKDTRDQCAFIESRLADTNLRSPTFIDKYTKDKATLKCSALEANHDSAAEMTTGQLGFFLRNGSSGTATMSGTNNYVLYLLHLVGTGAPANSNASSTINTTGNTTATSDSSSSAS